MRKFREDIIQKEERTLLLSDTVSQNGMAQAEMEAGKKEEAAMRRKQLIVAWRRWWSRFSPWERIRRFRTPPAQMPGKESEEEHEQRKASQQMVLPALGSTMKALQQVLLLRFGVQMVKCGEAGNFGATNVRKELFPTRQVESGFRWRMQVCEFGEWSLEERAFWQGEEK